MVEPIRYWGCLEMANAISFPALLAHPLKSAIAKAEIVIRVLIYNPFDIRLISRIIDNNY